MRIERSIEERYRVFEGHEPGMSEQPRRFDWLLCALLAGSAIVSGFAIWIGWQIARAL